MEQKNSQPASPEAQDVSPDPAQQSTDIPPDSWVERCLKANPGLTLEKLTEMADRLGY